MSLVGLAILSTDGALVEEPTGKSSEDSGIITYAPHGLPQSLRRRWTQSPEQPAAQLPGPFPLLLEMHVLLALADEKTGDTGTADSARARQYWSDVQNAAFQLQTRQCQLARERQWAEWQAVQGTELTESETDMAILQLGEPPLEPAEFNRFWTQVVPPDQAERLMQLGWWNQAQGWGWCSLLGEGTLGRELALTPEQRERLRTRLKAWHAELREAWLDQEWRLYEAVAAELRPEQQTVFWERLGRRETHRGIPPVSRVHLEWMLTLQPSSTARPSGPSASVPEPGAITATTTVVHLQGLLPSDLLQLVARPDVQDYLELSQEQRQRTARRNAQTKRRLEELMENHVVRRRAGAEPQELGLLELEVEQQRREYREFVLEEVLLPWQRAHLEQLAQLNELRSIGVIRALIAGTWSESLQLDASQQATLIRRAPTWRKDLDEGAIETIQEHRRRVESILSTAQRKRFERCLGQYPQTMKLDPAEFDRSLARYRSWLSERDKPQPSEPDPRP